MSESSTVCRSCEYLLFRSGFLLHSNFPINGSHNRDMISIYPMHIPSSTNIYEYVRGLCILEGLGVHRYYSSILIFTTSKPRGRQWRVGKQVREIFGGLVSFRDFPCLNPFDTSLLILNHLCFHCSIIRARVDYRMYTLLVF